MRVHQCYARSRAVFSGRENTVTVACIFGAAEETVCGEGGGRGGSGRRAFIAAGDGWMSRD